MKRDEFLRDPYARLAQIQGVPARSYYKLQEIDKRFSLVASGQTLLDLGAHPGGWLKYIEHRTKGKINMYALDLKPIQETLFNFQKFHYKQCDVETLLNDKTPESWLNVKFHGILSDLAPQTTGIRDRDAMLSYELVQKALFMASQTLRKGGFFVAKYYASAELNEILRETREYFPIVTTLKLKVTRSASREIFIIARNFQDSTH